MKTEMLNKIEGTTNELSQLISSLTSEQLNTVPFKDSWTAGQVADHIFKSFEGVLEILNDKAIPTKRGPDEKIESIKDMFLDFKIKMTSPEFILPAKSPHEKKALTDHLEILKTQMTDAIRRIDLSATYADFELPGFGKFTRLEWIYFLIYHMQRHIHQLKRIHQFV